MNLAEKVGMVLLSPQRAFELLALEESRLDGYFLVAISSISSAIVASAGSDQPLINFALTLVGFPVLWVLYTAVLAKVIMAIYKCPGSVEEFVSMANYSLVSLGPLLALITAVQLVRTALLAMASVLALFAWFAWLNFMLYKLAKAYFKIDAAQFVVGLFASWAVFAVAIVAFGLTVGGVLMTLKL